MYSDTPNFQKQPYGRRTAELATSVPQRVLMTMVPKTRTIPGKVFGSPCMGSIWSL